jgi:hypothetical protein
MCWVLCLDATAGVAVEKSLEAYETLYELVLMNSDSFFIFINGL